MKKSSFILSFIIGFSLFAQAQKTTYFDKNWNPCPKDSARYYRLAEKKDTLWLVSDYYITNELQMKGSYLDDSLKKAHGVFTYYYRSGQLSSKGAYQNNQRRGLWQGWHETGEKYYEGSADSGVWNYWYQSGKPEGGGLMIKDKSVGVWKWYYESGILKGEEVHEKGNVLTVKYYDQKGKWLKQIKFYEQVPEFKGGTEKLMKFISKNIRYPEKDRANSIEGRVIAQFTIDTKGIPVDAIIIKSGTPDMDAEVLRVISIMPKWKPGYQRGKEVNVRFTLPITFKLPE